jgi:hypothetical protein
VVDLLLSFLSTHTHGTASIFRAERRRLKEAQREAIEEKERITMYKIRRRSQEPRARAENEKEITTHKIQNA